MDARPSLPPLQAMFGLSDPVRIVDVGANPIDGTPIYKTLLKEGHARLVGFEPNPAAQEKLAAMKGPHETYLPQVVADGQEQTLHICANSGMTSLLEPNDAWLKLFYPYTEWSVVEDRQRVATVRLDDVPHARPCDLLKIDIQGGELMVFQNAPQLLDEAVVVHTETIFGPMYKQQPMFGDMERCLHQHGLRLHRFDHIIHRTVAPTDIFCGFNQIMWADAVFIRDLSNLEAMSLRQLLQMAVILHDCYASYDIVLHLLLEIDRRASRGYGEYYQGALNAVKTRIAYLQRGKMHVE